MAMAVAVELTTEERRMLCAGLGQWFGPARLTDRTAAFIGFESARELEDACKRLSRAIERGDPLVPTDWHVALTSTEVSFASDRHGAGVEWATCTGLTDEESIGLLRSLQRKLIRVR